MNGVHDLGGMHGFGPVVREANEPVFHADWERRMFGLARAILARRPFNTDEFRHSIERMAPAEYLATTYYEHWLSGIERLLIEKGVVNRDEIETAQSRLNNGAQVTNGAMQSDGQATMVAIGRLRTATPARSGRGDLRYDPSYPPRFRKGERVVARNINPEGHTRLPRYARGKRGVILQDWGVFVFPDTHAHARGANPQHCYAVQFSARELWGNDHPSSDNVRIDLWEGYLEHAAVSATNSHTKSSSTRSRADMKPVKKSGASDAKVIAANSRKLKRAARKHPADAKKIVKRTRKPR